MNAPAESVTADDNESDVETQAVESALVAQTADPSLRNSVPASLLTKTKGSTLPFTARHIIQVTAEWEEPEKLAARWLFSHCSAKNDNLLRAAARIKKSPNTLYRIWKGEYGASLANFVEDVNLYRRLAEERDKVGRPPFIETTISRKIWDYCQTALTFHAVAPIYSDSQIGKTFAAEAYARANNHGQTRMARLPSGCSLRGVMNAVGRACNVKTRTDSLTLTEDIVGSLDESHLLILDEIDEPLASPIRAGSLVNIYMWIRMIYDRTQCGLVLIGNDPFRRLLEDQTGPLAPWMRKLDRRGLPPLCLDEPIPDDDLYTFAGYFGLPVPIRDEMVLELIRRVAHRNGVKRYVLFLQAAKKAALTMGQPVTWEHFNAIYEGFAQQAGKEVR